MLRSAAPPCGISAPSSPQLPNYLIVQFVRFDWKKDTQKKAKVLKKVEFPLRLDISDLCRQITEAQPTRRAPLAEGRGRQEARPHQPQQNARTWRPSSRRQRTGTARKRRRRRRRRQLLRVVQCGNVAMDLDEEDVASDALQPTSTSGYYDLLSVITHKGRYADSGHYIGWSRSEPTTDRWWKYDDDVVSEVKSDDIKALSGGGDWHMAYLLVYKLDKDFVGKKFVDEPAVKDDEKAKAETVQQSGSAAPTSTS